MNKLKITLQQAAGNALAVAVQTNSVTSAPRSPLNKWALITWKMRQLTEVARFDDGDIILKPDII